MFGASARRASEGLFYFKQAAAYFGAGAAYYQSVFNFITPVQPDHTLCEVFGCEFGLYDFSADHVAKFAEMMGDCPPPPL